MFIVPVLVIVGFTVALNVTVPLPENESVVPAIFIQFVLLHA